MSLRFFSGCAIFFMALPYVCFAQSQFNGNIGLGYWSVKQNTLDQDNAQLDDGVGNTYLQDQYKLLLLNTRMYQQHRQADTNQQRNFYFVGKARYNLDENQYTLGYAEDKRYEISELSLEYQNLFSGHDLWLGRQTVFQSGGIRFDGMRVVFNLSARQKLGIFSGLGQDPRTAVGYIGDNYQNKLINPDFLNVGSYYESSSDHASLNLALNLQLSEMEIDRLYAFLQGTYYPNQKLFLSFLINQSFIPSSLDHLILLARYAFNAQLKNTLSYTRWSNIEYAASAASQIPSNGQFTPDSYINGDDFNDAHYWQLRDQMHYSFLKHHSAFAGIEYSQRSFDDLDRRRYFLGYNNSALFNPSMDLRIQLNLIDNYKSGHTSYDINLGKDFSDGKLRLESFYSRIKTERQVYLNNAPSTLPTENEREHSYGLNGFLYLGQKSLLHAQYQIFKEQDSLNNNDQITIQELYVGSNFKF